VGEGSVPVIVIGGTITARTEGVGWRTGNLLGDPKIVTDTLEFVEKTGRFNLE